MNKENKPCPFCGSLCVKSDKTLASSYAWYVWCLYCGAIGPKGNTEQEAWEKWNKRSDTKKEKRVFKHTPCPKCGSTDKVRTTQDADRGGDTSYGRYYVCCFNCWYIGPLADTRKKAWLEWDKRSNENDKHNS